MINQNKVEQVKLDGAFVQYMTTEDERNELDIALLKLPVVPLRSVELSSIPPQEGSELRIIGFPMFSKRPIQSLEMKQYKDANAKLRVALGRVTDPQKEGVDLSDENPGDTDNMMFSDVDVVAGFSGSMTLNRNGKLVGLVKRGTVQGMRKGLNSNTEYVHNSKNPTWHVRADAICDHLRLKSLSQFVDGCEEQHFDLDVVQRFLNPFRTWIDYPPIQGDIVDNSPHTESLAKWVEEDFHRLEVAVFGNSGVMKLQSCAECEMQTDSNRKIVFVNPDFVKKLQGMASLTSSREVIRFALAHEISHFIYESGIFGHFPKGKSLLGNKSLYGGSPISNTDPKEFERLIKIVSTEGARGHAEVDFYGECKFFCVRRVLGSIQLIY